MRDHPRLCGYYSFPEAAENIKFVGSSQKRYSLIREEVWQHYESYFRDNYFEKLQKEGFSDEVIEKCIKKESQKHTSVATKIFKVKQGEMASSWSGRFSDEIKKDPVHGVVFGILEKHHGITMNSKYFNSYGAAIESGVEQVKDKYHPDGCFTVKSTFDHEFAHQIDDYLGLQKSEKILQLWENCGREHMKNGLSEYAFGYYKNDGTFIKHSDAKEMIAEAWSEYNNNEKPREIAKIISEEVMDIWKKKK